MKLLLLLLLACTATCLEVGSLRLPDNKTYISYDGGPGEQNSRIICTYSLDEVEELSFVLYEILKDGVAAGSFEWNANATGKATGLLEDMVNLDRDDSDLELTALSYDLNANYTCTVTATDGKSGNVTDEILIIHTTTNIVISEFYDNEYECLLRSSLWFYPVFPRPTVTGGLYSESLGDYYEKVDNWETVLHPNGSVGVFHRNYSQHIDEYTPFDAGLQSEIGVTKANGTYIPLSKITSYFYFQHSCKGLMLFEHQTFSYNTDRRTCYGEPQYSAGLRATIECSKGYVSTDNLTDISMSCDRINRTNYQWVPKGDHKPEELHCKSWASVANPSYCFITLAATLMLCFYKL